MQKSYFQRRMLLFGRRIQTKLMISALDQSFQYCELLNSNQTYGYKFCYRNEKLVILKNMLHIVDVSYLTCPKRSIVHNVIHCLLGNYLYIIYIIQYIIL
jgi:hypothetical protein